ncbi:Glutamate-ammonia-ligase adenylyltransferase [Kingella potus]|uniref:Bifunctional glutamine synthetase adenylyltransferase/adenylyl-removing enzyme n=1 Tax=Kingella potus TaxID=265175 RepID=A0A377R2A4_9NEIS|nr:bifunctional [glutamate--ammonia ligase]-adenylyl-L-tyrosine phosphorylase/[glutamate--ammonia-ligase] adenylyltransferase [Kingella potus]STR00888.1 Glutamate-ammonia-ligase adenylyltransferase [Kingella potus]
MNPIEYARRFSPFLARLLDGGGLDTDILQPMLDKVLHETDFQNFAGWADILARRDEAELARQLRVLRRYVVAQIMVRDLNRISGLDEVTRTITLFADFAVNTALDFAYAHYWDLYGTPVGRHTGEAQHLSVVAMGKAGGYELNVSSDIDLIFVYPEAGETDGRRSRDNQEFFTKVGQKLIALLNDLTADGQVFRVDMRLRPDGDSGALVCSETALEQYLTAHGREWERYAWCKGRVLTPYPNGIKALVRPFVFRKYLDYGAYGAMRALHRQIRAEVGRKGMEDNIKLGAGGIREIEFVAQIFQMIRGGQMRALQLKGTQETLRMLAQLGVMPSENTARLLEAYRFLRDVEHRLQYWDDRQTQTLPQNPEQRQLLAESMGFADYAAFSDGLDAIRAAVSAEFDNILSDPEETPPARFAGIWPLPQDGFSQDTGTRLAQAGFDPQAVAERLAALGRSSRYRSLSPHSQPRFDALLPRLAEAAAECPHPGDTLFRLIDFIEAVSRRPSYLAFLIEYPNELSRVARLMGQSTWMADYLRNHPALLDEMLSDQLTETRPDWPQQAALLAAELEACDGTEAKTDTLRRFRHAHVFRLAVQDLAGKWTVESLSDQLSALADIILDAALTHAWREMPKTHRDTPEFAVIGYGKLGGKELGYTSDLDLVYLYDDPHPDALQIYSRLANRLTNWLNAATGAGTLYQTDLRLRPNGDSGFPAHSVQAFEKYQRENAWIWEHQALTRARFVCGSASIRKSFDRIRGEILTRERDPAALRREISAMREKIAASHPPCDTDVKYAHGGIVDVEFAVQYLILAHARRCPALLDNYGNIALLATAAAEGLIDSAAAGAARAAYRYLRALQHAATLHEDGAAQTDSVRDGHYRAVRTLWRQIFCESETQEAV